MNIQEAVKKGIEQKKMITRESWGHPEWIIPTNNFYNRMVGYTDTKEQLPLRGWQPMADDLMADDWYVTNKSYESITLCL